MGRTLGWGAIALVTGWLASACTQVASPLAGPGASLPAIHLPAWLQGSWSDGAFVYTFGPSDYTIQGPTEFLSFVTFNRGREVSEHLEASSYRLTIHDPDLGWINQDVYQPSSAGTVRLTSLNSIARGMAQVRDLSRR